MPGDCQSHDDQPDYLLLDEATSNLDAKSERAVLAAMDELMKNRTTVIIAHSLAAIRKADHVIVLSDARFLQQAPGADFICRR